MAGGAGRRGSPAAASCLRPSLYRNSLRSGGGGGIHGVVAVVVPAARLPSSGGRRKSHARGRAECAASLASYPGATISCRGGGQRVPGVTGRRSPEKERHGEATGGRERGRNETLVASTGGRAAVAGRAYWFSGDGRSLAGDKAYRQISGAPDLLRPSHLRPLVRSEGARGEQPRRRRHHRRGRPQGLR